MVFVFTIDGECIPAERAVDTHDGYMRLEGVYGGPMQRFIHKRT